MSLNFKIYNKDGQLIGKETFEHEVVKIGRLSSAHLRLEDDKISRIHAVVEIAPGGEATIIDMGSIEGTIVNGEKVNKAKLEPGDEILLGDTKIVFQEDEAKPVLNVVGDQTPSTDDDSCSVEQDNQDTDTEVQTSTEPTAPPRQGQAGSGEEAQQHAVAEVDQQASSLEMQDHRVAIPPPEEIGELHDDTTITPANWTLEVRHLWVDDVLDVRSFNQKDRQVVVGEEGSVDFFMPADLLPAGKFAIARVVNGKVKISFNPHATGILSLADGTSTSLSDLAKSSNAERDPNFADCKSFTLPEGAVATVTFGKVGFRFKYASKAAGYLSRMSDRLDYTFLHAILLVMFGYIVLIATIQLRTKALETSEEELYKVPDRYVQFILTRPKPQKKDLVFLEKLKADIDEGLADSAPRYKGKEGKMGLKGRPDTGKRSAVKAIKPDDKEIVGNRGLLAVLGAGGPQGLSTVMGGTGLGGELEGAVGNLFGNTIGNSGGFGGLGLKGTGTGGGGVGNTIGVGRLGTRGRGGGKFGYGTGVAKVRKRGESNVNISVGRPIIMGSLSMDIIRRVIHSHREQIKYCYSKELTRQPNLAGKVAVKFTISPRGYVTQADISETTLNNSAVEQCIIRRIRTWKFPEPKGGGIVIVNYPFILKPT